MKLNKIFTDSILYTLGEIIPKILSFLLLPILTFYLSKEEYGINSYITTLMIFLSVISTLSLNTYLLSQYNSSNEKKSLIKSLFYFILIYNIILLFIEYIIFSFLNNYIASSIPVKYFTYGIFINFLDISIVIPLTMMRLKQDAKLFVILSVFKTIIQYVLILIFVIKFNLGIDGSFLGRLLGNIPFFVYILYYIIKIGRFELNLNLIKNGLKFSLPLIPGAFSYIIITLSDRIILERYSSLDQLGIFSVAATLALSLNIIIQALYKSIEPVLYKNQEVSYSNEIFKYYAFIIIVFGFIISIFGKELLQLITSKGFFEAYKIIPSLTAATLFAGLNLFFSILLIKDNKRIVISNTNLIAAIISIILNIIFIPKYNLLGASYTTLISFGIIYFISILYIRNRNVFLLPTLILMALIIIIPYFLDEFYSDNLKQALINKFLLIMAFIIFSATLFKIKISEIKMQLINYEHNRI